MSDRPGITASPDLFRVYLEAGGMDGYPTEWHQTIKYLVREQAGNRCIRCGHPYVKGEGAEWSRCDEKCSHQGPIRLREAHLGEERKWVEHDLDAWGMSASEARMDDGPTHQMVRYDIEARWRILTVHHLNGIKLDCRWWNLASLCQRCHLVIQGKVRLEQPFVREHSEWFKPYAAGWYAHRYLNEDLTRDETMARLDELLALEWFQKALF